MSSSPWSSRADRGPLLRPHVRADGVMLVEGIAVREGVLEYRRADGSTFREFVPLATILDSAGGLARLPLTLQHPDGEVTRDNVGALGVGDVDGEVLVEDGGFVRVKLAIRRADALDAVARGTQELSPGYVTQIDSTPGTHPVYGPYDATQIARRYNHLALVDQARGGPEVRIRADGVATTSITSPVAPSARGVHVNSGFLPILSFLGITRRIDSDESALSLIEASLRARADADEEAAVAAATADAETTALQEALATATSALAALQAELDAAASTAAAEVEKADHANLSPFAASLGLFPSATPRARDLRAAIAARHLGQALKADASDAYVDAIVDIARTQGTRGDGRVDGRQAWDTADRVDGVVHPRKPGPSEASLARWGTGK